MMKEKKTRSAFCGRKMFFTVKSVMFGLVIVLKFIIFGAKLATANKTSWPENLFFYEHCHTIVFAMNL